jgi:small subunit ribosomal protein S1
MSQRDQAPRSYAMTESTERHPMLDLLDGKGGHKKFERGDVVNGTIAFIGEHEILIDVGAKYEGILAPREFGQMSEPERTAFAVGDDVECLVLNPEDRDGNLILSLSQVRLGQDWEVAEELHADGSVFETTINGHNKGGLITYVGQVRGFIPASQIDRRHAVDRSQIDGSTESPLSSFVLQPLWVKIIEVDRRKNRLILSEQAAMRERRRQSKSDLLDNLAEGQIVTGVVTSLADFGAFVDIGGADGLIHLSELSWNRVSHPREVLQLGDQVTVKVITVDRERKRIGLSLKQLQPEPWGEISSRFAVGEVVSGTITRLTDFGAFARLDGDVEGLIHVSELSDDEQSVADVVAPGDVVDLRVIKLDPERKRIGLSLKRAAAEYDALSTPEVLAQLDDTLLFEETEAAAEIK